MKSDNVIFKAVAEYKGSDVRSFSKRLFTDVNNAINTVFAYGHGETRHDGIGQGWFACQDSPFNLITRVSYTDEGSVSVTLENTYRNSTNSLDEFNSSDIDSACRNIIDFSQHVNRLIEYLEKTYREPLFLFL